MSRLWYAPAAVVAVLVVTGPLLATSGLVDGWLGFRLYLLGSILAALSGMALAACAALGTALGKPWRGSAARAAVVPLVAMLLAIAAVQGRPRWPFHEVASDPADAPPFVSGPAAGAEFPDEVAAAQAELFPDLAPIRLPLSPGDAFTRVEEVAREMPGWEILQVDPARGLVEAVATTRIFRFRDDVVIRVRPDGSGSRIDLRSRSRVGQSDLGANAERIRAFGSVLLEREDG